MKQLYDRFLLMAYVLAVVCVWPFLFPYVNNPDSFQYIGVARHILEGDFRESVNGYWSPLLSWLLLPFLLTLSHPVIAFKSLQVLIGLFGLLIWSRLCDKVVEAPERSRWLKLAAIPLFVSQALLTLTADLLFTVGVLGLVLFFLDRPVWNNRKRSMLGGLLGGLIFLSKSFGLPLFVAFSLFTFLHHRRSVTEARWSNLVAGLSVFAFICTAWILSISIKYEHFTVSEAAAYNRTAEVTGKPEEIVRLPILYEDGLVAPAGKHALSAWEEPMRSKPLTALKPLESEQDMKRWKDNLERNILSIWYFDFRRQAGIVFLFLLLIASVLRKIPSWSDPLFSYPLVLTVLVYAGYALILYHARYSWPCIYLSLLTAALVVFRIDHRSLRLPLRLLLTLMVLLAVKRPVKEILYARDKDVTLSVLLHDVSHPREILEETYRDDFRLYRISRSLDCLKGPFASRYTSYENRPRYFSSLLLADCNGQPYHGQIDDTRENSARELHEAGIRYLLVWDDDRPSGVVGAKARCSAEGVTVYELP
jgi:hypothetical protein